MPAQTTTSTRRGTLPRRISLLPLLALAACGETQPPTGPGDEAVAAVQVTAPAQNLAEGETMQLAATARGRTGEAVPGVSLAWSSSNETVATVSPAGLVTARAPGQAAIRAIAGGRTGETTLTVAPPTVASIEIAPGGVIDLDGNGSVMLRALARTAAGTSMGPIGAAWSSSDPQVARVTEDGIVHAGFGGTATITATVAGKTAQATVRVRTLVSAVLVLPGGATLRPGETVQMHTRALSASRDTLERPVSAWASENPGVATVDATGRVTAHRPGSVVIRATVEGVEGRMIIFVTGPTEHRLEGVDGQPLPATMGTRIVRDAAGTERTQRIVATGGYLRFTASGYEQRLTLEVYEGDVRVGTEVYEDRGEVWYHALDGYPILHSTVRAGLQLPVTLVVENGFQTGEMTVAHGLPGTVLQHELRFGKP
jgi:hypothetical protein